MGIDFGALFAAIYFVGIIYLVLFIGSLTDKKRANNLKNFFEEKGFTYKENIKHIAYDSNLEIYDKLESLEKSEKEEQDIDEYALEDLYNSSNKGLSNIEIGKMLSRLKDYNLNYLSSEFFDCYGNFKKIDDLEISLIGYHLDNSACSRDNYPNKHPLTLCMIYKKDMILPEFSMQTRSFFQNFYDLIYPKQSIIIKEDNYFSSRFILEGSDDTKIRDFFSSYIRRNAFLKNHKNYFYYKSDNNCLIVYRYNINNDYNVNKQYELLETALKIFKEIQ